MSQDPIEDVPLPLPPPPLSLEQNYPNPFNPTTIITYNVPLQMHIFIKIYSDDWQEVKTLVNREHAPGRYSVRFDAKNEKGEGIGSGEYFYVLEGGGAILIRKMKLLK